MQHETESQHKFNYTQSAVFNSNRSNLGSPGRGLQRRYSQNWSLPSRISALLIARTYSVYTKGRKDPREKFERSITDREWWREQIKDTPIPGHYNHRDFIDEIEQKPIKATYNFLNLGRRKTACVANKGMMLQPGLYSFPDMTTNLEKREATCAFKSSGRKYSLAGYKDKHLKIAPWQYDIKRDPIIVEKSRPSSPFKSQSKRFVFKIAEGPPPGSYEIKSELDTVHSVQSCFKSTTKRPCNTPNTTKTPGPGTYEPTTGQRRCKRGKYKAPKTVMNMGRQHGIYFRNAFEAR